MAEALSLLGAAIAICGLALMLLGAVGGVRLPDFYTRLHAAGLSDWGGALVLLGLACLARQPGQALALLCLALLAAVLQAAARHALADAARAAGEARAASALERQP